MLYMRKHYDIASYTKYLKYVGQTREADEFSVQGACASKADNIDRAACDKNSEILQVHISHRDGISSRSGVFPFIRRSSRSIGEGVALIFEIRDLPLD
jgi:hypothetical protein